MAMACRSLHRCIINSMLFLPLLGALPPHPAPQHPQATVDLRLPARPLRKFSPFPPHKYRLNRVTFCSKQDELRGGTHVGRQSFAWRAENHPPSSSACEGFSGNRLEQRLQRPGRGDVKSGSCGHHSRLPILPFFSLTLSIQFLSSPTLQLSSRRRQTIPTQPFLLLWSVGG
ncbi:hypothetical protein B0T16DRAFT_200776 [Cercophora newfieldiana]|uniref:Secreted protein n=1 Tax=Cercophora newfieldiana TaxID=92897 RepID=A0AA39XV17_9PEZI|nr:hypothetical protein B0T16DRAFT_200776 [Cercophora newfieldiana]